MPIDNSLPPGYNRFRNAVAIVDPGASNPAGVALATHTACRAAIAENVPQRTDPAIRLMVTQLAFLVDGNADLDLSEYGRLLETCRARGACAHEKAEPSPR